MFLFRRLLSKVSPFEFNLMRDAQLRREINEIIRKKKIEKELHEYFRKCDYSNYERQLKSNASSN